MRDLQAVESDGLDLSMNRVALGIGFLAEGLGFHLRIGEPTDVELREKPVLGDVNVIQLGKPCDQQRRTVCRLERHAMRFRRLDVRHVGDQREHPPGGTGK